jgi:hypothetical protein
MGRISRFNYGNTRPHSGRTCFEFVLNRIGKIASDSFPFYRFPYMQENMTESFGSCECGQIQYKVAGPVLQVVACHCALCRSMTGAPFSSYVVVNEKHFAVTSGHEILANYAVTERTKRHFCVTCGTPIFNSNPHTYNGLAMIYLGTVVGHENLAPEISIFCESKLGWVNIHESSKSFPHAPTRSS